MYLIKERRSNGLHFNARAGLGTGGTDAIGFSVLSRYLDPRFNSFHPTTCTIGTLTPATTTTL